MAPMMPRQSLCCAPRLTTRGRVAERVEAHPRHGAAWLRGLWKRLRVARKWLDINGSCEESWSKTLEEAIRSMSLPQPAPKSMS